MIKCLKDYFPERVKGYFGEDYLVTQEDTLLRFSLKWELFCTTCEKSFVAAPSDVFRGNISCACGYRYYKTPELKAEKLLEVLTPKQVTFPEDVPILHSHQKVSLSCLVCGLEWLAGWSILVNRQSGCARCAGRYSHSDQEYIDFINTKSSGKYFYVSKDFDGKIVGRSCVNVQCNTCDLVWRKQVSDAMMGRFGCPACQTNGYSPRMQGYFYILSVKKEDKLLGFKFGISNYPEKRLKIISNKSGLDIKTIALFSFENGAAAQNLETEVKKSFGNFLNKSVLPDGFTETISPSELKQLMTSIHGHLEVYY